MPDQIFTAGPLPAPLKYNVPGSQQMIPRACQALFNGTGASGSFVPALVFRSQAGHVIARIATDTVVAAGASAEVSWFPHVGSGSTGAGLQRAGMSMWSRVPHGPYTVDALSTFTLDDWHFSDFDAAFFTANITNGVVTLSVPTAIYFAAFSCRWENADFPRSSWFVIPFGGVPTFRPQYGDNHVGTATTTYTTADPTGLGQIWTHDTAWIIPQTSEVPIDIWINVQNGDVVDRTILERYLSIYVVGTP